MRTRPEIRTRTRTPFIISAAIAVAVTATGAAWAKPPAKADAAVARGAMFVHVGGCNHCHTPWVFNAEVGMPIPDMRRMLSGHPSDGPEPEGKVGKHDIGLIGPTFTSFAMPFGTLYAPNLTPDPETGLGSWTEKMFVDAIKTGKHMGGNGRAIMPPMPWMDLAELPDADLKAIFAFLRSIPPVKNAVPAHKVPDAVYVGITEGFEKVKKMKAAMAAAGPGAKPAPAAVEAKPAAAPAAKPAAEPKK
ncbi:MAG: diheme cytochrome c-553 [Pseudomonadota bacterium]